MKILFALILLTATACTDSLDSKGITSEILVTGYSSKEAAKQGLDMVVEKLCISHGYTKFQYRYAYTQEIEHIRLLFRYTTFKAWGVAQCL